MGSDSYIESGLPTGTAAINTMFTYFVQGMPVLEILRSATYGPAQCMES
ncbi:hypothetical protein [Flagellimonas aurea]